MLTNPFKRKAATSPLAEPPSGMGDFCATVHVTFREPQPMDDEGHLAHWYVRNFGVRAAPTRVHEVLSQLIDDGEIDWPGTEWRLCDPSGLDRAIRKRILPLSGEGIWYRGGRIFYSEETGGGVRNG